MAAVMQLMDIMASVRQRSAFMRFSCRLDTARASVLPRNIISIAKKDSNFGACVRKAKALPTHLMMKGSTPIYVRISNIGTTRRIGSNADVKKFICGTCTQSGKANAIPS